MSPEIRRANRLLAYATVGAISLAAITCARPYISEPSIVEPAPTLVPATQTPEPEIVRASKSQKADILALAETYINPGYFPRGVERLSNPIEFWTREQEVRSTIMSPSLSPQPFDLSIRYKADGSPLQKHILFGIPLAGSMVFLDKIPGSPLGERPYERISTSEGLMLFARSALNLPPGMRWEFGPKQFVPWMSPEGTPPSLIQAGVGKGFDEEGQLYIVNVDGGSALIMAIFPEGHIPLPR